MESSWGANKGAKQPPGRWVPKVSAGAENRKGRKAAFARERQKEPRIEAGQTAPSLQLARFTREEWPIWAFLSRK